MHVLSDCSMTIYKLSLPLRQAFRSAICFLLNLINLFVLRLLLRHLLTVAVFCYHIWSYSQSLWIGWIWVKQRWREKTERAWHFCNLRPVREAVNDRGLFTAGWFGVREKYCFQLIIHDRIRASEQARVIPPGILAPFAGLETSRLLLLTKQCSSTICYSIFLSHN